MKRLRDFIYRVRQGISAFFYNRMLKQPHYRKLDNSQLFANWLFQRIFRINSKVPYSVHFSSHIQGSENILFKGNPESAKISFAVSGGGFFLLFHCF
jgi:hypothetical protein